MGAIQVIDGLDRNFFKGLPRDLSPGDSVELYGDEGCGKTELLLHFCVTCILPRTWSSIAISGKETKVIFIDTSYKFPLWRLIQLIEHRVRQEVKAVKNFVSTSEMNDIVASCLQRLFVLQCSSSLNLIKSLSFLEKFLNENPEISALMLDNISEFYWMDRAIGGIGRYEQETNQRSIISKLRKYQKTHSLVILLVKSAIMNKQFHIVSASNTMQGDSSLRSPDDYLSPEWNRFVTYKYLISKKRDYERAAVTQTWYFASMNKKDVTAGCKFIITDAGIEFLPNGLTS